MDGGRPGAGADAAESRYLVRLSLRLLPEAGSTVRAWLSYDEGGSWRPAGSLEARGGCRRVPCIYGPGGAAS